MDIPIRNIYYLLCYAWDQWDEGQSIDLASIESPELADLFAQVLLTGTNHVLRRGLDRGYLEIAEDTPRLRGRIDFDESLKRTLFPRAYAHCHFDELSYNVLHNRILKSTIARLIAVESLDDDLRSNLTKLHQRFVHVDDIELSRLVFRRIQLHSNNAYYRFLMNVCELIQNNLLVSEETGQYYFRDFLRDRARFWSIYENFVYHFFRMEQNELSVSRQTKIEWNVRDASEGAMELLPSMSADIVLKSDTRAIIIDTKFYKNTLQVSNYRETFHSSHLYQIFAYLKNIETWGGVFEYAEGVLLYPTVNYELDYSLQLENHRLRLRTIDLSRPWREIHESMIDVLHSASSDATRLPV